ncbi:predicted protein [Micromonas commoda]|uniref:Helicase ATP-binding domain-containing protein n=1 Tax=Micromonas commoda (strain RCC299 / NOUM17 / CCMP2709) TaxID=296587 RepID=C1FET9_MICCC|nr:predicted protein [Micromonas commoda]ACO69012.1 predicted protein [Micromonas commoda]|eukprot:XP_002507754.1 predicted protein [Micromonas commoda]
MPDAEGTTPDSQMRKRKHEDYADIGRGLESTSSADPLTQNDDGGDDVLRVPNGGWPNHVREAAKTLKDLVDGVLQSPQIAERKSSKANWQLLLESFKSRAKIDESRDATGKLGDLFELFCVLFLNYWNAYIFSALPRGKITQICWLRGDEKNFPKAQETGYERRGQDLTDKGSDVVLRHQTTGHMTLVQCKFRSSNRTAADEGGFFQDLVQARDMYGGRKRHGLWMGTDAPHPRFEERGIHIHSFMRDVYAKYTTQDFLEYVHRWCEDTLAKQIPRSPDEALMECNYTPRPAQERQLEGWKGFLDKCWGTFSSNNSSQSLRAQMSMWCGTGKTFTAFLMIKEFVRYTAGVTSGGATVVYFVPSLWLMEQTFKSFFCQCRRNQIKMGRWLLVGSNGDRTLTQGMDARFGFLLSTSVDEISQHLKEGPSDGHNVIISTYNSWKKCAGALEKVQLHPDLVIYDEAHRTVGIIDREDSFKRCILDDSFPCRVRLFMTATPKDVKVGDDELGDNEFKRGIVNSMNETEKYGEPIADPYTQAQAADAGDIVRSKVIALMTDNDMVREYFGNNQLVLPVAHISSDDIKEEDEDSDAENSDGDSDENSNDGDRHQGVSEPPNGIVSELPEGVAELPEIQMEAYRDTARCDWLCAAIHIVEAIRDGKYKVVFCFTRTIKQARAFQRRLQSIREMLAEKNPDENLGGDYPIEHMHGRMNMTQRKEILSRVEEAELGIVCAAKVLNEGIDIPFCDTVVFLEAKGSVVDIAQCSGRCNRLYPGKEVANIVIPALISEDEILNPGADDLAGFQVLRKTLSLLCVLDEELRAVLCGGADANPDGIHRREGKFEIARIGRADRVRVDLQALVDRLNIAEVLLESRRRPTKEEKVAALAALSEKPKQGEKVEVKCASGEVAQEDLGMFWSVIRQNFGPKPDKANTKLSAEEKKKLLNVEWVKKEVEKMEAKALNAPEVRATKEDKLAALAALSQKPKVREEVEMKCASGEVAQEDLGMFWDRVRLNFGPNPDKAGTNLSDEEKKKLLAVEWVRKEVEKMKAMASNAPEVRATKEEKVAALAALSERPKVKKKVVVKCASGEVVLEDLGMFWSSIRQIFGPNPDKAKYNLSEEEKKPLLAVEWVRKEVAKMMELGATKADKVAALVSLSKKPKYREKVDVKCASGEVVQEDLGKFWDSIRQNFGPNPDKAGTNLSEEEKTKLLNVEWVKMEVAKMMELRATKADKLAALVSLSERPKHGEKVDVKCASAEVVQEDLGKFWDSIRQNFGPNPDKANTSLSEEEKKPLLAVEWVKKEVEKMEAKALNAPEVRATKEEKVAALAALSEKPKVGEKVQVKCASGEVAQEDLGLFWSILRQNFGPKPDKAHTKLSAEEKKKLLNVEWVKKEVEKM